MRFYYGRICGMGCSIGCGVVMMLALPRMTSPWRSLVLVLGLSLLIALANALGRHRDAVLELEERKR